MHILILGAGYAGVRAAIDLDRLLGTRTDVAQVTLVDRNLYHQHISLLHLTATGHQSHDEVAIPLDRILRRRRTRFVQGSVARIAPLERQVVLADGLALPYDRLVIALGSTTTFSDVPGAQKHAWPLRSFVQARALCDHIESCVAAAARTEDATERETLLSFAVVGGGFTGVQLVGELADWLPRLCTRYGVDRREARFFLIERSGLLLRQFGTWASNQAASVLRGRGIDVLLHTSVERVTARSIDTSDTQSINAATVVWAGGVRAPALLAESGLHTDERGRVPVDRYLRAEEQALIFAAGDCARVPDGFGEAVPATASYAMRQGEHLARTLLAEAQGRPPRQYEPLRLGQLVSLGPGEAVGDPLGLPLNGLPLAALKQAVEYWYLTTLQKVL